jgi:hypothetical protein
MVLTSGAVLPVAGFIESCDNRLIGVTRYFDPCLTIFSNCAPGDFEVNNAEIGDFCVDPACTVPGACGPEQPLGTITDVCP